MIADGLKQPSLFRQTLIEVTALKVSSGVCLAIVS